MSPAEHQPSRSRAVNARWIVVLPGALLAVLIAMFPIHWAVMLIQHLGTSTDDSGSGSPLSTYYYLAALTPEVLEYFGNAFFTPIVFIAAGANIAPKFKFATGIGLALALGVFYGAVSTQIAEEIADGLYTPERWLRLAVTLCLWVAGVAVGLVQARNAGKRQFELHP